MPERLERIHYIVCMRISVPFWKNKSRKPLDGFIHFDTTATFFCSTANAQKFPLRADSLGLLVKREWSQFKLLLARPIFPPVYRQ